MTPLSDPLDPSSLGANAYSLVFGGPNYGTDAALQQAVASPPPQSAPTPAPAPSPAQAPAPPQAQAPVASDFQPTQLSAGQRRFDRLLMAHGAQPYWQNFYRQQDAARAMSNMTTDPLGAISNLAKVPGMQDEAARMYDQYNQNKRLDQTAQINEISKKDLVGTRVAGILGASNEKSFPAALNLAQTYIKNAGLNPDDFDLPTSYDPDAIQTYAKGWLTPEQQENSGLRQAQIQYYGAARQEMADAAQTRAQAYQQATTDRGNYDQGRLKQMRDQIIAKTNQAQEALRMKNGYMTQVKTSQGMLPMQVAPGGQKAKVTFKAPDGGTQTFGYIKNGNGWKLVGRIDEGNQ